MKTNQEIFDTVATHLLTQQRRAAVANGTCAYRTPDGLKCAVGCLIPDEVDLAGMNILQVRSVFTASPELFAGLGIGEEHLELLVKLQGVHDNGLVCEWPVNLRAVADCFSLEIPALLASVLKDPRLWLETV